MKKRKFMKININSRRKGVSVIILIFSVLSIFTLSGLVIDMGIVMNCRYELQKAVEATAIKAVSDYNAYEDNAGNIRYPGTGSISGGTNNLVDNNLDAFVKSNSFLLASSTVSKTVTFGGTQSRYSRAIRIDASVVAKTYFLNLVGIRSIKLQSSVAAMNAPVFLNASSVINGANFGFPMFRDTEIKQPVGGTGSTSTFYGKSYTLPSITNVNTSFDNIIGFQDAKALSLGPGGYITIKLPATLVDGKGFDLQIVTAGNANGYFVFAGTDANPNSQYVDAASPGGGINWVNISCTGTPIGTTTNGRVGAYNQWIDLNSNSVVDAGETQPKFYGSGYFDIGASCSNGYNANVKSAKYLKIIDDNIEDGFILKDPKYDVNMIADASFFPGQNSSITPGVSIDSIAVEHHPRLIRVSDFNVDTDNDGLIDVFENSLDGLRRCGPSDGAQNCSAPPASNDALEFWGYTSTGTNNVVIDTGNNVVKYDYPTHTEKPPLIFIKY